MSTLPEQFSAVTKAHLDTQLALLSTLANKAFENVEKMMELNLAVAKASFEESSDTAKQLMTAKDPQEFFSLTAAHAQPNANKAVEYTRHLTSIFSSTQAELVKLAEAHVADANRAVISTLDKAPAGSESCSALVKNLIGSANASYEQMSKVTKQAIETLEANLDTAANHVSQATPKSKGRARSAA